MGFEDEMDDILRELLREPGMVATALGPAGAEPFDAETAQGAATRRTALGGGAELVVLADPAAPPELDAAVERAARELRACARRYGREDVLELRLVGRAPRTRTALVARITRFLEAFAAAHGATCALVLRGAEIVATGGPVDDARRERLQFLRKRVDAEADKQRGQSSHAEVVGDDVYACSFWFDAYLVAFFDRPFSLDFVRHRARAVARELSTLLPHLDDDPTTPAVIRPRPE